jgi:hypothetical protein
MEDQKKIEVENLAWELFQSKLGFRFRIDPTPEEKKCIIDTPEYQYYRDKALKIVDKKQKRKDKLPLIKKYPIIKVDAFGKPNWYKGARTWCFVYSKNFGNFILEGYVGEVKEYLEKNYTHYFCYVSMWSREQSRGYWLFWKNDIGIFEPSKFRKNWKYEVRPYTGGRHNVSVEESDAKTLKFKRMPKHWIPEFDKL